MSRCPLTKEECMKEECKLYANVYDDTCDITSIAIATNETQEQGEAMSP